MAENLQSLGIIAGSKSLPLALAEEARRQGLPKLVAVAFEGETDPRLAELVHEIEWLRVGQLSRMIEAFKKRRIAHCVMAGQIAPRNLFDLRPDWRAMMLLLKIKEKNAHTLFTAIANELAKEGIELIEATPWLRPLMPGKDFLLGPGLSEEEREDLLFGYKIAREVSRLEIGQLVVVKNGTVLAVEGFEGTDACLQRGGTLAGKKRGAVAVKVAKLDHDFRFDIPCAGANTISVCAEAGIRVLGLEAGRTLLLDQEAARQLCREKKISVTTV